MRSYLGKRWISKPSQKLAQYWHNKWIVVRHSKVWEQNNRMTCWQPGGRGIHMSEVYRYVPLWQPPLSDSSAVPETHLFTPSVSSYELPFSEKFSIFRPISLRFWQNFSSKHTNFGENFSQDPSFLRRNLFCKPYFWKPMQRIPTKKSWLSLPPPLGVDSWLQCSVWILCTTKRVTSETDCSPARTGVQFMFYYLINNHSTGIMITCTCK